MHDAIETEDLFALDGVYGDERAGWPVQIDELKLISADETVEIIVLNRAIILLLYDDDEVRRIHRVLFKLDESERRSMAGSSTSSGKTTWSGRVVSVQPRIRLSRSFDERSHNYLGYVLLIDGTCDGEPGEFLIAVGEAAHRKHRFEAGMELSGSSAPVEDERKETASLYKTSGIKVVKKAEGETPAGPPFRGLPPDLETYRFRGHRRLAARTYDAKCTECIWGCRMPVEMTIDHWNPSRKKYRFETFCYGPKSCPSYRPGPERKVPRRHGMSYTEEDWVDEEETAHRGPDD
ncbi:MAG: hypothetical protein QM446_00320 [Synergistota bacterium]|nr:hypothetical protein [Synergistota bacterium]